VAGHDPDKEPRIFDSFCPFRNVTKDYPPSPYFFMGTRTQTFHSSNLF
jgi:hypothetical protein